MFISYQPPQVKDANKVSEGWRVAGNLSMARIARGMSTCIWSPIVWRGGSRKAVNFERADWLGLDFDEGLSLSEAIDIWQDSKHIIGTTKSNGIKGDRFRVLLKLSETCTSGDDYAHTVNTITRTYGGDTKATDAARFFFPCVEIVSTLDEGYTQEILVKPPDIAYPSRRPNTDITTQFVRRFTIAEKFPLNEYNTHCFMIGADQRWNTTDTIDETVRLILESPTYIDMTNPPVKEIRAAVTSGYNNAERRLTEWQKSKDQAKVK